MVAAVAEHGYPAVTISELVALAGISKRDFYESFASKEECFLATFSEIVEQATQQVRGAYRGGSGFRGRLAAVLLAFAELLAQQPEAAALVIVDSLGLGTVAVAPREAAETHFAELLRQSLAAEPERGEVSEPALRGIIGGTRRVVYRCLREGRPERFGDQAEALLDWALGYQRPGGEHLLAESFFAQAAAAPRSVEDGEEGAPGWGEPAGSARSRSALAPRERIVRAVARLAAAGGYASLSMPAIAAAAGVSNKTFYREFKDKQEAFLAAFEALAARALAAATAAFQSEREWPEAVGAALAGTLSFIAADPLFARLAFFELAAAGPAGLEAADRVTQRFMGFLSPAALPAGVKPAPEAVVEAIGGGIWTVLQHEVAAGRGESLPDLAPEILDFALVPFGLG